MVKSTWLGRKKIVRLCIVPIDILVYLSWKLESQKVKFSKHGHNLLAWLCCWFSSQIHAKWCCWCVTHLNPYFAALRVVLSCEQLPGIIKIYSPALSAEWGAFKCQTSCRPTKTCSNRRTGGLALQNGAYAKLWHAVAPYFSTPQIWIH